jgi:ketosteroid isomerase-like protein
MAIFTAPADAADRVAWLVDREEIRALVGEFGRSIDDKDQAAYAATFAEDAELALPFGSFSGRAAIAAMQGPPPFISTQHLISSTVIEVTGDTATARSYLLATHAFDPTDKTQKAHSGGWYDQRFVRTPDGWRFSRVELVIVWEDARPMMPDMPGTGPHPH